MRHDRINKTPGKIKHWPDPFHDSQQQPNVCSGQSILSPILSAVLQVWYNTGCRTAAATRFLVCEHVSSLTQLDVPGQGCQATGEPAGSPSLLHCSPSPSPISPPSCKPHYEREKAHMYSLLPQRPLHHGRGERVRWRIKKKQSGAKCERGLVSMPTAGGRSYAANQPGSLQDTCFCPSCFLSSPALPCRLLYQ